MAYYKKIDKSVFNYGIAIPKEYVESFLLDEIIEQGTSREIIVNFKKENYSARIIHLKNQSGKPNFQIRWDNNIELLRELKKEFIQTYFAIESQNYDSKIKGEYYRTNLLGGNQEVLIVKAINSKLIELETFIKIETPYDNIFRDLVEKNVFGWLSKIDKNLMITKSTPWLEIKDLIKHENTEYVVYYLLDDVNKELYIGSAKKLGDRVKIGRNEIPNWNKFRYEIIHPKYHSELREIEYHSIMNFARIMKNNGNLRNSPISDYVLVNKDYKFYQK
jgi:hypothetical protein